MKFSFSNVHHKNIRLGLHYCLGFIEVRLLRSVAFSFIILLTMWRQKQHMELLNTPLLVSKINCVNNFLQQKNCSKLICDSSDIEGPRIYLHCLRFSFSRNKLLLFFYLCGLASWLKIVFGSLALVNMGC